MWVSWYVLGAAGFRVFRFFFLERTWGAARMRPPCFIYHSTSMFVIKTLLALCSVPSFDRLASGSYSLDVARLPKHTSRFVRAHTF